MFVFGALWWPWCGIPLWWPWYWSGLSGMVAIFGDFLGFLALCGVGIICLLSWVSGLAGGCVAGWVCLSPVLASGEIGLSIWGLGFGCFLAGIGCLVLGGDFRGWLI